MYELVAEKYELECMNLLMSKSPLCLVCFFGPGIVIKNLFSKFLSQLNSIVSTTVVFVTVIEGH